MKLGTVIRKRYGNQNSVVNFASKAVNEFFCLTSVISPKWNTKLRYRYTFGKKLDLKHPRTFIEKCCWYKVNIVGKHAIYRTCSDKYAVRDFIRERGCGQYLNELIAVYDRVEDIRWEELPESFAMKLNDGAGYYIICDDKTTLDPNEVVKKLKGWWKEHNYLLYAEMQNKAEKRRIVVEKYIKDSDSKQPTDYKIYCFNGVPKAIMVVSDRGEHTKKVFMSTDWSFLSYAYKAGEQAEGGCIPECPKDLVEMLRCAEKLSKGFPFVRVDLYQGKDGPIFGELTFTCAGALFTAQTDPKVMDMAKLFELPGLK